MSGNRPIATILIIDRNQGRARELHDLLQFMGVTGVIVADGPDWRDFLEPGQRPKAVLLGDPGSTNELTAMVRGLTRELPDARIVLVEEARTRRPLPPALGETCRTRLCRPFRLQAMTEALEQLARPAPRRDPVLFRHLQGNTPAIVQVRNLIERVAPSQATVLVTGESGTGKEVVARNLHYFSPRRTGPFVAVNCAAIPPNLVESELFGHEKGAFTGADTRRKGRFEQARGGTLFLDEIGDMPLALQVKLLRVIQERAFQPVGASTTVTTDIRLVAATHRDLEDLVATGHFREDLYYRLCVFPIHLPPLRERIEDLPVLVADLTARIEQEQGCTVTLTDGALEALGHHTWPGNLRELANLMERLAILYPGGRVDVRQLPSRYRYPGNDPHDPSPESPLEESPLHRLPREGLDLKHYLGETESSLIRWALQEANGVVARAADLLGLRRTTLVEKMRRHHLDRERDREPDSPLCCPP